MKTPGLQDHRFHKAMEVDVMTRTAARKRGIQVEMAEHGLIHPYQSLLDSILMDVSGSQRVVHDLFRFTDECVQVCLALKAFRVNLVNILCAGGPSCNQPLLATTFNPPMGA